MEYTLIYKTREFASLLKKEAVSDTDLIEACREMSEGLIDVDLGCNLFKKRFAAGKRGKRGGFRAIIAAAIGKKYFFLYVFAKNKKANISPKEKLALKELAKTLVSLDSSQLNRLVEDGELMEVGEL